MREQASVLFVCLGNTCRSVIAEALARKHFGAAVSFSSAGLRAQPVTDAANAVRMLAEDYAVDASAHVPRGLAGLDLNTYDYLIALDEEVRSHLRGLVSPKKLLFWNVDDPWGDPAQYRICARQTEKHIKLLGELLNLPPEIAP